MSSVYPINKGINKPVEFYGLKAQYIWYLGAGLLLLLILFAVLYICGINSIVCLLLVFILGTALFMMVLRMSHRYGQFGMIKAVAKRSIPEEIKTYSRNVFLMLK